MLHKYKKNLLSSYIQTIIAVAVPLIVTPVAYNLLGEAEYGIWILLMSIINYFNLSHVGFNSTLLKSASEKKLDVNVLLNTTLATLLGLLLITLIPFFIISANLSIFFKIPHELVDVATKSFVVAFSLFAVNFIFDSFGNLLFAYNAIYIKNYLQVLKQIFTALVTIIILNNGADVLGIAIVNLTAAMLYSILVYYFSRRIVKFKLSTRYYDSSLMKKMISPSIHYFIISISVVIVFYTDNILISVLFGVAAVTNYSVTYKITDISRQLIGKIVDVLFPAISNYSANNKISEILKLHNKMLILAAALSAVAAAAIIAVGDKVLVLWLGNSFVPNQALIVIFAVILGIQTVTRVSGSFIAAIGVHKNIAYVSICEAVLNIVLSLSLQVKFGIIGIALGTLVSCVLTSGWYNVFYFYRYMRSQHIKEENNCYAGN